MNLGYLQNKFSHELFKNVRRLYILDFLEQNIKFVIKNSII